MDTIDSRRLDDVAGERRSQPRDDPERQHLDSLTRLQKSALRLAFSLHGRHPELDQQLNLLRGKLKVNRRPHQITEAIEEAIATIMRLEPEMRSRGDDGAFAALAALAGKVNWPEDQIFDLRRVQSLLDGKGTRATLASAVTDFGNLVNACLSRPATSADAGSAGSLRSLVRMLDRLDGPPDLIANLAGVRRRLDDVAAQADATVLLDEIVTLLSRELQGESTSPAWTEALVELLERVSLPAEFGAEVAALRADLAASARTTARGPLVARVAGLLAKFHARLRRETEEVATFLRQTLLRLQSLHAHLLSAERVRSQTLLDSERVNTLMQSHMSAIRSSMDGAASLTDLKAAVVQGLDGIDGDIRAFIDAERRRQDETEKAVTELSTQLQDLESETLHLRESLREHAEKAVRDALTGVANRMGYEERLAQEYSRWRRHGRPLSMVVFDIDFFKSINDQYGHQAGDRVLVTVAEQLRRQIRESDFFARYGGEEFVLLLPETRVEDAIALAEKLRHNVEQCKFRYGDSPVPVTVSCGVAGFRPGEEPETVFQRADLALYNAKRSGRNRCCSEVGLDAA